MVLILKCQVVAEFALLYVRAEPAHRVVVVSIAVVEFSASTVNTFILIIRIIELNDLRGGGS